MTFKCPVELQYSGASSCGYIEPVWKLTIYRPKTDIFIKLFSQDKVHLPYQAINDT